MTKQEKIQEEWIKAIGIKNYNLVKYFICENGTIYEYKIRNIKFNTDDVIFKGNGDNEPDECQLYALQGIENNNGWIKIESEEDLPIHTTLCHVLDFELNIGVTNLYKNKGFISQFTHYQPIVKPQPPLY